MTQIKACVSVKGRFHAFNLAQQLVKKGMLNQLITSYPKFEVVKYGIPRKFVSSIISNELLSRCLYKLYPRLKRVWDPRFFLCEYFDHLAAKRIKPGATLFIGWSGISLASMRQAKKMGMKTVVERGSSHIVYQSEILTQEYAKFGLLPEIAPSRGIEKELKEYDYADYISVPSSFVKNSFIRQGIHPDKIIVVNYGVDAAQFSPSKKNDDIFRVIFCGSITLRKGVQYLLQAFYELNLPNSELWLIGPVDTAVVSYFKKFFNDKVYLKGAFPQARLYELYSQGSVFCMPSIEEGLAMVILQAMACGLPVICSVNTGGPDAVREGLDGFVVPIRDVNALKEKISFMYENQNICKEMGISAYNRMKSNFTWDHYAEKIVSEYSNIMNKK